MSIRIGRTTYNASMVGDCSLDFGDPIPGSNLAVDVFGLDSMTRPYRCRIDEKDDVEKKLQRLKNKEDFEFPGMALVSWAEREDGPAVQFDCLFKGLYNDRLPEIRVSGGMSVKTLTIPLTTQLEGLPSLTDAEQIQVTYLAPTFTIRYVTRGIPSRPSYAGRMDNGTDVIVQRIEGASSETLNIHKRQLPTGGPITLRLNGYNVVQSVDLESFTFDQVGLYAECTETNAVELRPVDFASRLNKIA